MQRSPLARTGSGRRATGARKGPVGASLAAPRPFELLAPRSPRMTLAPEWAALRGLAAANRSNLLVAAAGIAFYTLLMGTRTFLLWRGHPSAQPLSWHLEREAPLWLAWVLVLPALLALSRRFPVRPGNLPRSLAAHGAAALGVVLLSIAVATFGGYPGLDPLGSLPDGAQAATQAGFGRVFLANLEVLLPFLVANYVWIIALDQAVQRSREAERSVLEERRLHQLLTDARLSNLHDQIRPHFLCNALHAISSVMTYDVERARCMTARLADLLRLSLDQEGREVIPVAEELEIVDRYLDLQKLRFEDRLSVAIHVDERVRCAPMPPFLLQMLVENSIRHGIERRGGAGRVEVEVRSWEDRLRVVVRDDGPGFQAGGRMGTGLSNLRDRLAVLYGSDDLISTRNPRGGGAQVEVLLPLAGQVAS